MKKIAFIFPGQGAQYIGMGKDFYENIAICKKVYQSASEITGIDIEALCFEENDKLNITEFTQIAMVTTEIAILKALEERGFHADVTAGLSLGEYAALVACGAVKEETIYSLIRKRGIFMQEAYPTGGAMTAILGLDAGIIETICEKTEGIVGIANYNCPGQIVISGEEKAVSEAAAKMKDAGAKRCISLKVSGPFHSPLLSGAGVKLRKELCNLEASKPVIPYISNVTANIVLESSQISSLLEKQVSSPVKWQQTIEKMIQDGVTDFIEIGPGKTLSNFVKKINPQANVFNVEKLEELEELVAGKNGTSSV